MSKFKFRLETLLKLRGAVRDERRAELAQAYQAEEILSRRRREIEQEIRQLGEESRAAAGPGQVSVDWLLDARRYELVLRSHEQLTRQQEQALAAEIERRRRALVDANRDVRVLETLRERQKDRHRREAARLENKDLDEAAARKSGEW
jgi:flagellar export protein FliJ